MEKPDKHNLSQVTKVINNSDKMCIECTFDENGTLLLYSSSPKLLNPSLIMRHLN